MLKKILNITTSLLLLLATTGFTVSEHYCGSRIVDVAFDTLPNSCCDSHDMDNCCHDKTEHFQVKENFVGAQTHSVDQAKMLNILPVLVVNSIFTPIKEQSAKIFKLIAESPPPPLIQTVLSLLQVYRL